MPQTLTCAMPVLFTFNLQTKFEMSSFPRSRYMAWAPKWSNESRDPDHVPFRVDLTSAGWDLLPLTYRPNLKFLTTPIMKIWGSGAKCTNWGNLEHLEVTQGHPQCHHSIERIRLLSDFNRNHASILYRFRDIASYLSKVANFNPPRLHLAPP